MRGEEGRKSDGEEREVICGCRGILVEFEHTIPSSKCTFLLVFFCGQEGLH